MKQGHKETYKDYHPTLTLIIKLSPKVAESLNEVPEVLKFFKDCQLRYLFYADDFMHKGMSSQLTITLKEDCNITVLKEYNETLKNIPLYSKLK